MKTKSKKRTKPQIPEYTRPTKEELIALSNKHASIAMYTEMSGLAGLAIFGFETAREHYITAEAYERWADQIAAEEVAERWWTEFEADVEKVFGGPVSHHHKPKTNGVGQWFEKGTFTNKNPYSPARYEPKLPPETNLPQPYLY